MADKFFVALSLAIARDMLLDQTGSNSLSDYLRNHDL